MHPCLGLSLFLTVLQAATIPKLEIRADVCDPLASDCPVLPNTIGTTNLDPSLLSGLELPAAPNQALSFNTDANPGSQYLHGNGAPSPIESSDPSNNENTQVIQTSNQAMNVGENAGDIAIIPQIHMAWYGFCHIYGVGCQMCYATLGDFTVKNFCQDAVLRGPLDDYPDREHNLCLADSALSQVCIDHDPADDTTPAQPAPVKYGPGWWGYCDQQDQQCAICWKHETGESTGCVPAAPRTMSSSSLPTPAAWLCYINAHGETDPDNPQGPKNFLHECVSPSRWIQGSFGPS